jgi:hypothetical protein
VHGVRPEASEPLRRIELAAREVFAPWLSCVLVTGSVLKDDFVPGYSDLDVRVFVAIEALQGVGGPPRLDLALAFRERIGDLTPAVHGFSEFQVNFRPYGDPASGRDLPPGSYRLLYGEPPAFLGEITEEELLKSAACALNDIDLELRHWTALIVDRTDDRLGQVVRGIGSVLRSAAYSAGVLLTGTPFRVWASDLEALDPVLDTAGLESLTAFFASLRQWPRRGLDPEFHRILLHQGFDAMAGVQAWWALSRGRLALAPA